MQSQRIFALGAADVRLGCRAEPIISCLKAPEEQTTAGTCVKSGLETCRDSALGAVECSPSGPKHAREVRDLLNHPQMEKVKTLELLSRARSQL